MLFTHCSPASFSFLFIVLIRLLGVHFSSLYKRFFTGGRGVYVAFLSYFCYLDYFLASHHCMSWPGSSIVILMHGFQSL